MSIKYRFRGPEESEMISLGVDLGVDPGAHAGIALVASPAPGGRPVLVGVWRVDKLVDHAPEVGKKVRAARKPRGKKG